MSISVTNMLKTALSKSSAKDQLATQQQSQGIKLPEDSSKLEKQLKSFISKLQSGASFITDVYRPISQSTAASSSTSVTKFTSTSDETAPSTSRDRNENESIVRTSKNKLAKTKSSEVSERSTSRKEAATTKQASNMPTFEDLMESEEFKTKTSLNFESDSDEDD